MASAGVLKPSPTSLYHLLDLVATFFPPVVRARKSARPNERRREKASQRQRSRRKNGGRREKAEEQREELVSHARGHLLALPRRLRPNGSSASSIRPPLPRRLLKRTLGLGVLEEVLLLVGLLDLLSHFEGSWTNEGRWRRGRRSVQEAR
jgi:hypothetical protein